MKRRQFVRLCAGICLSAAPSRLLIAGQATTQQQPPLQQTGIVLDKLFLRHQMEPGHPESPLRLVTIMQYIEQAGLLPRLQQVDPADNMEPALLSVHTREHIESIRETYPRTYPVAAAVVGAAIAAVDSVCSGSARNVFCATRPPGHHATNTGREEGFCFFNAVAIAARHAQSRYQLEKILIVDWDYHHGNGTELAFYNDPSVLFFSTHDFFAYPGTGDPSRTGVGRGRGYNINVHLDCGATDADILRVFMEKLVPAVNQFRPDLILISAGFDSRKDDLLGCFNVTDDGFVALTRLVMSLAEEHCNGRIISILEGGYNVNGLASSVVAHINTLNDYKTE